MVALKRTKASLLAEAAPDLLTALEQMQDANGCFDGCRGAADRNHGRACLDARAAIAKARGETPCAD